MSHGIRQAPSATLHNYNYSPRRTNVEKNFSRIAHTLANRLEFRQNSLRGQTRPLLSVRAEKLLT
jgi:hypothetical protein